MPAQPARSAVVVRWAAIALLGVVAAAALADLGFVLLRAVAGAPDALGWQGYAAVLGAAAAAAALLVWIVRRPARRSTDWASLGVGLGLLVALRLAAIWLVDAPLIVDWRRYHDLAVEISRGGPLLATRPTGYPILLSILYRIGGPDPTLAEWLNLAIAAGGGMAIYALALRLAGSRAAGVALLLYAVAPAQVLMTTVVATEMLQGVLLTLAVVALAWNAGTRGGLFAGVALGMSQYVRATSMLLVPPLALVAGVLGEGGRRERWLRGAALAASFIVLLLPVAAWNASRGGLPTPSTSSFQAWQLLVGTNQAEGGRFNEADLALVGGVAGTPEAEAIALRVALARIGADPIGVIGLDIGKVWTWGDEHYGARWALYAGNHDQRLVDTTVLLSQLAWAATAGLAVAGVALCRSLGVGVVAAIAVIATMLLTQLLLEANPRYHAPLVPLVCVLAGLGAAQLAERSARPD